MGKKVVVRQHYRRPYLTRKGISVKGAFVKMHERKLKRMDEQTKYKQKEYELVKAKSNTRIEKARAEYEEAHAELERSRAEAERSRALVSRSTALANLRSMQRRNSIPGSNLLLNKTGVNVSKPSFVKPVQVNKVSDKRRRKWAASRVKEEKSKWR